MLPVTLSSDSFSCIFGVSDITFLSFGRNKSFLEEKLIYSIEFRFLINQIQTEDKILKEEIAIFGTTQRA